MAKEIRDFINIQMSNIFRISEMYLHKFFLVLTFSALLYIRTKLHKIFTIISNNTEKGF